MAPFTVVEGPEAWVAADYVDPASYTYTLTAQDIAELDGAVAGVLRRGLAIQVSSSCIPSQLRNCTQLRFVHALERGERAMPPAGSLFKKELSEAGL